MASQNRKRLQPDFVRQTMEKHRTYIERSPKTDRVEPETAPVVDTPEPLPTDLAELMGKWSQLITPLHYERQQPPEPKSD